MIAAAKNMAGHEDQALNLIRQVRPKVCLNRLIVGLADDPLEASGTLLRGMVGMKIKGDPKSAVVGIAFVVFELQIQRATMQSPVVRVGHAGTNKPSIPIDCETDFEFSEHPPLKRYCPVRDLFQGYRPRLVPADGCVQRAGLNPKGCWP
ncbi:hypothetical protein HUE56_15165 [Azospirillum oryzae]|uniref:Uncharacterized protein n=1 Tax=Azospirillum oryzae TaxID=286727 RepID=A0A6N1AKC4_9PROT|nr:hypothetical protein [Azospirillum oryzae]KAA0589950.1 hypothetical protein FZ938_10165 [Azospirillum oryzae]QKS51789.1 hypothetical protein HUE56_15165 [Azospirillum oryzae]